MFFKKLKSWLKIAGAAFFLTSFQPAFAQCPSSIPNLSSYQPGAALVIEDNPCLPKTITLLNMMAGTNSFKYYFNYTGGSLSQYFSSSSNTHTYNTPGEYTVILYSEKGGYPLLFCTKVVVADTLPPTASLLTCSNGDAKINFDAEQSVDYEKYLIEWGDGDIDEIFAGYKTASHTYANSASYLIKATGINPSTGCRGGTATFNYTPTVVSSSPPSLVSIEVMDQINTVITLQNPAKLTLKLLNKVNNGAFEPTGVVTNKEHEQLQVLTDSLNVVCYKLEAVDNCLTDYNTGIVCTAPISARALENGNEISLTTTSSGTNSGISKIQLMKDGQPWKEANIDQSGNKQLISDTDLSCGRVHCYQLLIHYENSTFKSQNKCVATHIGMCGVYSPIYVPTAFSPNGDSVNDLFEIKGTLTTAFEITIYDKWGSALFYSNDQAKSWDGNYKKDGVPVGTYTYVIRLKDKQGKELKKTGSVTVVR